MKSERTTTIIKMQKNKKYLSEVIDKLPCGIFNKSETGLGATTLELNSKRHSIIVEPLKVTASFKATKHNACYIGSATRLHSNKDKDANIKRIKKHLNDKSVIYKKFITVADSLSSLLTVLGDSTQDYFLLIDEADRTQLDVNFRSTMENVLDIYKAHDQNKRCLLTATPIHFNDPELKNEPYYICELDSPSRRKINLISTGSGAGVIIDSVVEIYNNSTDKIVIAINDVSLTVEMSNELVNAGIDRNEIQILCSSSSSKRAGEFFNQIETSKLSKRITFKTCAYFNGFDIDDRYHLYTYVQPNSMQNIHSDKTMKQIAGRCRDKHGLLSENIIYQKGRPTKSDFLEYTYDHLIEAAKTMINTLSCMDHHLKHSYILKKQAEVIFEDFSKSASIYGYPLVTFKSKIPTISYLSIDAILEMNNVINKQYSHPNDLYNVLSIENDVTCYTAESLRKINTVNTKAKSITEEKNLITKTLSELIDIGISSGDKFGIAPTISQLTEKENPLALEALNIYEKFRLNVDNIQLKNHILDAFDSSKVSNQLRKLKIKLTFICADENDTIKQAVKTTFELGKQYTSAQVQELMLELFQKHNVNDMSSMKSQILNERFNMIVDASKTSMKGFNGRIFKVKGYNTLDIDVISSCKEHLTKSENFRLLMQSSLN